MRRIFPAFMALLIAFACCVESGEKIIGESIREDVFVNKGWAQMRNEVIIETGKAVKVSINVTEPSELRINYGGQAKLRFVLKYPEGKTPKNATQEWTQSRTGGWMGDRGFYMNTTGPYEFSVNNLENKPAYLWYTLYVVPAGTPDEKIHEYYMGNSTEVEYLILS